MDLVMLKQGGIMAFKPVIKTAAAFRVKLQEAVVACSRLQFHSVEYKLRALEYKLIALSRVNLAVIPEDIKGMGQVFRLLGCLYTDVDDLRDPPRAVSYLQRAIQLGDLWAHGVIAQYYEAGRGGLPKDVSQAVDRYCMAIKAGDDVAAANLLCCLADHADYAQSHLAATLAAHKITLSAFVPILTQQFKYDKAKLQHCLFETRLPLYHGVAKLLMAVAADIPPQSPTTFLAVASRESPQSRRCSSPGSGPPG